MRILFILRERKVFHFGFQASKPFFKCSTRFLLRIKVDEDMSHWRGMCMNCKKGILRLIESLDTVHLRSLDKFTGGIVSPSMILTAHHKCISCWLLQYWERTMATDIVKCPNLAVFAFDKDKWVPCYIQGSIRSSFFEMRRMGCI